MREKAAATARREQRCLRGQAGMTAQSRHRQSPGVQSIQAPQTRKHLTITAMDGGHNRDVSYLHGSARPGGHHANSGNFVVWIIIGAVTTPSTPGGADRVR